MIEQLENRQLMAAHISGAVYEDVTGNGLSRDDKGQSAVVVNLYKDVNANGKLDAADGAAVASQKTKYGGAFKFSNLAVGKYLVTEVVPEGYVRTTPEMSTVQAVNVTHKNGHYKHINFSNFNKEKFDANAVKNITYTINGTKTVTDLRNQVNEGDVVVVKFTLTSKQTVSFVTYKATAPDGNPLSDQKVYDSVTATLCAGTYCLKVRVPNCYFQIDFVGGKVIDTFGAAGSNVNYTNQERLIKGGTDIGGTKACTDCGPDDKEKDKCKDKDKDKDCRQSGKTWCNLFQWVKNCFKAAKARC